MIEIKNLNFSYSKNKKYILKNINIRFDDGLIGILGPNGCGKSTLMKIISGVIECFEGEVFIFSRNMKILSRKEISDLVSYLPQSMSYDPDMSVIESLISVRSKNFVFEPTNLDKEIISKAMEVFDLTQIKDKRLSNISGGELQRVFIAMCFLRDTKIYIFDEPLNNLDIKHQIEIMKIIKELSKRKNVLGVFHDINIALNFCDRIVLMKDGTVKQSLLPNELTDLVIKSVFDVDCKIVSYGKSKFVCFKGD